jgi:hypothetical protein
MPIKNCRAASRLEKNPSAVGYVPRTAGWRWRSCGRLLTAALAVGETDAFAGTQASLAPDAAIAPGAGHDTQALAPAYSARLFHARTPSIAPAATAATAATAAPAPAATAPAAPAPISPDVIMQSFFSGLSNGRAQSGANNAYYVSDSGFAGQTFGLLFTDAPTTCGALSNLSTPLPIPNIQICSNFASHGGSTVVGQIDYADQSTFNASLVGFTNAANGTGYETGTAHLTGSGGFPIAFNYSAQACDTLAVLPACLPHRR